MKTADSVFLPILLRSGKSWKNDVYIRAPKLKCFGAFVVLNIGLENSYHVDTRRGKEAAWND